MQETAEIDEVQIPHIEIIDIKLKEYNGKGIRLYIWGNSVRCDVGGKKYWTSLRLLKRLVYGRVKYCYFGDNWWTDEERKVYIETKKAEFKARVKRSLRS